MSEAVTRNSWSELLPMPEQPIALGIEQVYSASEFAHIQMGFRPRQMEDKWFIFFESPWLYFHRSWTGYCIYALRFAPLFDGIEVIESWGNNERAQWQESSPAWNKYQPEVLIKTYLLANNPSP